jgi:hypothetical protein
MIVFPGESARVCPPWMDGMTRKPVTVDAVTR